MLISDERNSHQSQNLQKKKEKKKHTSFGTPKNNWAMRFMSHTCNGCVPEIELRYFSTQ